MAEEKAKEIRILLVDDEPDFREILAFSFHRRGYQVLTASNGREAFSIIQSQPIDVVVSDIRMPGGDGIELLDSARAQHPSTPIILLVTGFSDLPTDVAYDKGAEAIFSKPFDLKVLEETIERLLIPAETRWTRRSDHVDVELKVALQFAGLPEAMNAKVVSLGRGGMFVTLGEGRIPNVNDTTQFQITFGTNQNGLMGSGTVCWVRTKSTPQFPAGCGIEFTFLGDSERQQVLDFVRLNQPKAYIPNK